MSGKPPLHADGSENPRQGTTSWMERLDRAGVSAAAGRLGFDPGSVFAGLGEDGGLVYCRFRWSVGLDRDGDPLIHALPPEEELGWTAWERWGRTTGGPRRESWVSVGTDQQDGWHQLDEDTTDLRPRLLRPCDSLAAKLALTRVDAGFAALGVDVTSEILAPLGAAEERYLTYRWAVVPHWIAEGGPVVYAIPPLDRSAEWPWESWYLERPAGLTHHVHYTASRPGCPHRWREDLGVPQRPPEVLGRTWWWRPDSATAPAMSERSGNRGA